MEVSYKIDQLKFKQLQNETENNSNSLTDNLSKLNFLVQNL